MRPTLVVGSGPALFLLDGDANRIGGPFLLDEDPERAAGKYDVLRPSDLPRRLVEAIRALPADVRVAAAPTGVARPLQDATGRPVDPPSLEEVRRARARLPWAEATTERRFLAALGRARVERALRSPEEVLISLAREEERVERSVGRESRATETFVVVPNSPLERHLPAWARARSALGELSDALKRAVEEEAQSLAPNLSAVVGSRVAARLISSAGGISALARMPSARIQLLGSRRRPSPDRGPRFGVIYRAERMGDVPLGRRGAYARSLAALAAIAVRTDASSHRDVSMELVRRRDRRVDQLRRRNP